MVLWKKKKKPLNKRYSFYFGLGLFKTVCVFCSFSVELSLSEAVVSSSSLCSSSSLLVIELSSSSNSDIMASSELFNGVSGESFEINSFFVFFFCFASFKHQFCRITENYDLPADYFHLNLLHRLASILCLPLEHYSLMTVNRNVYDSFASQTGLLDSSFWFLHLIQRLIFRLFFQFPCYSSHLRYIQLDWIGIMNIKLVIYSVR